MISIYINENNTRFEYLREDGAMITGNVDKLDEKLSDVVAEIKKKKTNDEIEAEEKKLKEAEAMTEIFDKMMELEETVKSIQESIKKKEVN
jgi:adenine-specific DNA glycosylase